MPLAARVAAAEVRRLVGAAAAVVHGVLRIRADRACAIDHAAGLVRGEDALRGGALLDPSLEVGKRVEGVGPLAAACARHHEQAEELLRLAELVAAILLAAVHSRCDLLVVLDAAGCRVSRAAPEVGEQELTAALPEGAQVRIDGVDERREVRVGISHVAVEIERAVIPARIVRSEEHTSELQSPCNLVCRLLLEKK